MGKHIHRLSEKDLEARTAICAACGPVRLVSGGKAGMRCLNAKRAGDKTPRRKEYMQEYGPAYYRRTGGVAQRKAWLKQYGLTPEEYDAMVEAQDGKCLVCLEPPPEDERLHVDHCHRLGHNRGLLCRSCNTGLGLMDDDPERLRRAADYLEASRQ